MEEIVQSPHINWDDFIFSLNWKGFVYYLPAFLKLSLDIDGPVDIGDSLLFMLGVFLIEALPRDLDERQKLAVVHVLEYLASEYRRRGYKMNLAQEALDRYWTRPEITGLGRT